MPTENRPGEESLAAPEAMQQFFDLLVQGEIEPWIGLMDQDIVFEFPYAPPGLPPQITGKQAMRAHISTLLTQITLFEFLNVVMHPTLSPDTLIVEFACRGQAIATGKPYNQRYISVVQMKNGKIARYRDYWNPLIVLDAMSGGDDFQHASDKSST